MSIHAPANTVGYQLILDKNLGSASSGGDTRFEIVIWDFLGVRNFLVIFLVGKIFAESFLWLIKTVMYHGILDFMTMNCISFIYKL